MKILSITAQKPHSTGSGVYLTELVKQWDSLGHTQAVVAGVYQEDAVDFPAGVGFYPVYFNSPNLPFPIVGMSDTMPYQSTRYRDLTPKMVEQFSAAFQQAVTTAVEQLNPDVIVCHHLYLLAAMVRHWFPDKVIIGICHGTDLRQVEKIPLERDFIQTQIPRLNGLMSLHGEQEKEIQRIFACPGEKIHIVGAGYNQDIFYPSPKREQRPWKQLAFAGKVTEKKGVFSLLRALEQLPYKKEELQVKLAGGHGAQQEYEQIQALAKAGKYQVDLLGPLPQAQLAELFRQSDVFVLPSFFEGLPLVNLEAMACGCKVVCTDLPGIAQWYNSNIPGHCTRFVTPPAMKNVDEAEPAQLPTFEAQLAEALYIALEQPGRQTANLTHISWKGISQKILDIAVK